jgi:hypothetical protein
MTPGIANAIAIIAPGVTGSPRKSRPKSATWSTSVLA